MTPSQLFGTAVHSFVQLRSYRVSGGLHAGDDLVVLTADVLANGDSSGTIMVDGESSKFIVAENVSYFSTLSPLIDGIIDPTAEPALARLYSPWWQAPGSAAAHAALASLAPRSLVDEYLGDRSGRVETMRKDPHGIPVRALTNATGSAVVSTGSSPHLMEVTTAPHYFAGTNLSSVDLVISNANEAVTVQAPPHALPLENLDGLPPYFTVAVGDTTGCDDFGCTASATVTATVGHGTATVHFTLGSAQGTELATCAAPVTIPAVGQSATASCRATGSAWTSFAYSGGGTYTILGLADNPAYEPASINDV